MLYNLLPLVVGISPSDICFVLCLLGDVPALHRVALHFEGNRIRTPFHELCDMPERIFLFQKALDVPPVVFRELIP